MTSLHDHQFVFIITTKSFDLRKIEGVIWRMWLEFYLTWLTERSSRLILRKMCDDISVLCWLQNLRYKFEYYEPYDVYTFSLDDELDMEESFYENIWHCVSVREKITPDLNVKYGEICRVSVEFCDEIDLLEISPLPEVVKVQFEESSSDSEDDELELKDSEDVMLWKSQLRNTYYEEEENILEHQVGWLSVEIINSFTIIIVVNAQWRIVKVENMFYGYVFAQQLKGMKQSNLEHNFSRFYTGAQVSGQNLWLISY